MAEPNQAGNDADQDKARGPMSSLEIEVASIFSSYALREKPENSTYREGYRAIVDNLSMNIPSGTTNLVLTFRVNLQKGREYLKDGSFGVDKRCESHLRLDEGSFSPLGDITKETRDVHYSQCIIDAFNAYSPQKVILKRQLLDELFNPIYEHLGKIYSDAKAEMQQD